MLNSLVFRVYGCVSAESPAGACSRFHRFVAPLGPVPELHRAPAQDHAPIKPRTADHPFPLSHTALQDHACARASAASVRARSRSRMGARYLPV
jgi:hypothetical protein